MIECVRAALLTPAGRLLLIRRTWPGATPYWVFPGGHVEPGDPSLRAALIREVREETGAEPQITGLLHVLADEHLRQYFYLARIRLALFLLSEHAGEDDGVLVGARLSDAAVVQDPWLDREFFLLARRH